MMRFPSLLSWLSASRVARVSVVTLVVAAQSGCFLFGLSHRIDKDDLASIPNEEKLLLFDAENGVYIAKDEIVTAERALEDARRAKARAEAYDDFIDERQEKKDAIDTPQVIAALIAWNEARIAVRSAEIGYREQQVETADDRLWAARAEYELAKAQLVRNFNPEEGNDIAIADFEAQVKDQQGGLEVSQKELDAREAEMRKARETYAQLSVRLQNLSGGAYGGPWADLAD